MLADREDTALQTLQVWQSGMLAGWNSTPSDFWVSACAYACGTPEQGLRARLGYISLFSTRTKICTGTRMLGPLLCDVDLRKGSVDIFPALSDLLLKHIPAKSCAP